MTIFDDWSNGAITDDQALIALCSDLGEVESELAPLTEQREQLRAWLGEVLAHAGGKATIAGFGRLEIGAPAVVRGYDKKELDRLVDDLLASGQLETAARLAGCRTETARAGGLRIVRGK